VAIGPPKTAAGRRAVAVPSHIVAGLDAHLARYTGPDPDAATGASAKELMARTGHARAHAAEQDFCEHPQRDSNPCCRLERVNRAASGPGDRQQSP